jgi:hypothetical protein
LLASAGRDVVAKWLYADFIIGAHASIILMERKTFSDRELPVSERSLPSGRIVLKTLIDASDIEMDGSLHLQ